MLRIIASIGMDQFARETYPEIFRRLNNEDYEFYLFDHYQALGQKIRGAYRLDELYRNRDKKLLEVYDRLVKLIDSFKADVLIVSAYNIYHPEFVKDLNVYTVLASSDDPDASYVQTVPYVRAFDHVTCVNVIYHENIPVKMTDKLREWGAKRATWRPMGVKEFYYDPELTEEDILNKKRDIDLVYIGGFNRVKSDILLKLKKAFGQRFKIYGNWGWKVWGYCLMKYQQWVWVRILPQELFVPTYQNTKIGINLHLSGQLGNARLYQLPMNGVMQVCDCADVLGEVFEPGKEIVGYRSIDEAIELIRYYLEHDDERRRIAAAGFRRAVDNYRYSTCFYNALEEFKKGMREKGIKHLKDGTPLEVD